VIPFPVGWLLAPAVGKKPSTLRNPGIDVSGLLTEAPGVLKQIISVRTIIGTGDLHDLSHYSNSQ
jgi:hypothetical protein